MGKLHEVLEHGEVESETFVAYKQDIIAYLQEFVSELARMAPRIRDCLKRCAATDCAGSVRSRRVPTRRRNSAALATSPPALRPARRHLRWFLGEDSDLATVELLRRAARGAINRILRVLERIHDQRFRQVNRTADLLRLAGWFTTCPTTPPHTACSSRPLACTRRVTSPSGPPILALCRRHVWWQGRLRWSRCRCASAASRPLRPAPSASWITPRPGTDSPPPTATPGCTDAGDGSILRARAAADVGLGLLTSDELDALLALLDRLLSGAPAADGKRACRSGDGLYALYLEPPGSGRRPRSAPNAER